MQTGSTASTAVGTGLVAASATGGAIASALGLGTSAKVATAGLSLAAMGQDGLFCAGLVLLGLGIVLNLASLAVRRQLARELDTAYIAANAAEERRVKAIEERAKAAEERAKAAEERAKKGEE